MRLLNGVVRTLRFLALALICMITGSLLTLWGLAVIHEAQEINALAEQFQQTARVMGSLARQETEAILGKRPDAG